MIESVEKNFVQTIAVCLEDKGSLMPVQTTLEFKAMGFEVVDGHHMYEEELGRRSIDLLRPSALMFSTGFCRRTMAMALKRMLDTLVVWRI